MRRNQLQVFFSLALLGLISSALAYSCFYQLYQRGTQAEAQLMLSYLNTLQHVYRSEHGHYGSFRTYYGAPLRGQDNCAQPRGAAELGFVLHGCHKEKSAPPRYAYRSFELSSASSSYHQEAKAGSDLAGRSLVCFDPDSTELWQTAKNFENVRVESCW